MKNMDRPMKKEYVKADMNILKVFDGDVLLFSGDVGKAVKGEGVSLED